MGFLKAFGAFWYDFVIGDDWKIAAYTVLALGAVAALAIGGAIGDGTLTVLGTVLLGACFAAGVRYDAGRMSK